MKRLLILGLLLCAWRAPAPIVQNEFVTDSRTTITNVIRDIARSNSFVGSFNGTFGPLGGLTASNVFSFLTFYSQADLDSAFYWDSAANEWVFASPLHVPWFNGSVWSPGSNYLGSLFASNIVGKIADATNASGAKPLFVGDVSGLDTNAVRAIARESNCFTGTFTGTGAALTDVPGWDRILYISPSGNDATAQRGNPARAWANFYTYSGGTRGGVCQQATNGDTIIVLPGLYHAPSVPLNVGVKVQGIGWPTIIRTNLYTPSSNFCGLATVGPLILARDNCTITGLKLIASTNANPGTGGPLDAQFGNYFNIANTACALTNYSFTNVVLEYEGVGNSDGIYIVSGSPHELTLRSSKITGHWDTCVFMGPHRILSFNNVVTNLCDMFGLFAGTCITVQSNAVFTDFGSRFYYVSNTPAVLQGWGGSAAFHGSLISATTPFGSCDFGLPQTNLRTAQFTGDYADGTGPHYLWPIGATYWTNTTTTTPVYDATTIYISGADESADNGTYLLETTNAQDYRATYTNSSNPGYALLLNDPTLVASLSIYPLLTISNASSSTRYIVQADGTTPNNEWAAIDASEPAPTSSPATNGYTTNAVRDLSLANGALLNSNGLWSATVGYAVNRTNIGKTVSITVGSAKWNFVGGLLVSTNAP